jgi:hypothetical protein
MALPYEIADQCVSCIKEHKEQKGKFQTKCQGIPKTLMNSEKPYYPLEKVVPPEIYNTFTEGAVSEAQVKNNKLLWAKEYLNWSTYNTEREFDQWYQRLMLNCTAQKKVFRCGRRIGKTETLAVDAIHFAENNPGKNVIIVGPFQNLIDEIFDRLCKLLDDEQSAYIGGYERKRQPNILSLPNGSKISGFTTGVSGDSIRGQSAHRIYMDEAAYIPPLAFRAVLALLMENRSVSIVAASTPSALETNFKKWCLEDPEWKEFHFPSTIFPYFHELEDTFRRAYTQEDYELEIEAKFIEGGARVFKSKDVEASLEEYEYIQSRSQLSNPSEWLITIGADWNEFKNGVQLVVLGFNKTAQTKPFRILNRIAIHHSSDGSVKNNVQIKGVRTIMELYRAFQADYVYVDRGHGSMQSEELSKFFFNENKPNIFKAIDFSSNYPFEDLFTGETINKRMKVMMVYFLQKRFEFRELAMSREDETKPGQLADQLNNYAISKYDNRDQPIFDGTLKGDHTLDALMLSVFAFMENFASVFEKTGGTFASAIVKPIDSVTDSLVPISEVEESAQQQTSAFDSVFAQKPTVQVFNQYDYIIKKPQSRKSRGVDVGIF